MKFAARDGSTSRTLSVTSPGWFRGTETAAPAPASTARPMRASSHHSAASKQERASRSTTVKFARGEEIFVPGHGTGQVYIVRSGCVRIYKTLPDGRAISLGLLGPNTVFAQEDAFDGISTGAAAEALVDSSVTIVAAHDLADLIAEKPELANSMVKGMTRRLTELQTLAEHLLVRDTSVRLATTLLSLAKGFGRPTADGMTAITLPVTHQSLANMIGSNRVTVTRKLLEMQERGMVRSLGRNAIAVDPEALLIHAQSAADGKDEE